MEFNIVDGQEIRRFARFSSDDNGIHRSLFTCFVCWRLGIFKEWTIILKPLDDTKKTINGENYVTRSLVVISTGGLKDVYFNLQWKQNSAASKSVIASILNRISVTIGHLENNNTLALTIFLDPRFKQFALSRESVTKRVKRTVISLITGNIKEKIIQENNIKSPLI